MQSRHKEDLDAQMTAGREERKFLLTAAQSRRLVTDFGKRLQLHHYAGEGANRLPEARHYVTTVYFDTPSRELFRATSRSSDNIKLRAKEYYDLHPQLTELATDPRQLVRFRPVLYLEIKHKRGTYTGKRRFGIPKRDVPGFFAAGHISPEMMELQESTFGEEAASVTAEIAALCGQFTEPLGADCLVNYRRLAWQSECGTLRITLDRGITFYRPPPDLWTRNHALVGETLGQPCGVEKRWVLEVKVRGERPPWLETLLEETGAEPGAFSKFEAASQAVHG